MVKIKSYDLLSPFLKAFSSRFFPYLGFVVRLAERERLVDERVKGALALNEPEPGNRFMKNAPILVLNLVDQ